MSRICSSSGHQVISWTLILFFPNEYLIDITRNDPALFQEITWKDAQRTVKECVKVYETCYQNWKVSGNHEDLENSLPFSDFTHSQYVIYGHHYFLMNDGLLAKMAGFLPEEVFFESSDPKSVASVNKSKKRKPEHIEELTDARNFCITLLDESRDIPKYLQYFWYSLPPNIVDLRPQSALENW